MEGAPNPDHTPQPVFYYDLADPESYLAAERIMTALPVVPEWEPVLGSDLAPNVRSDQRLEREQIERRALELDIQPLRWPESWPPDSREAMLAAAYAKRIGRGVAFSLAAFRQAFAAGRDLADEDTILIAGAACEMHPTALLKAMTTQAVNEALAEAAARARAAGVASLPAIEVTGALFCGSAAVEQAAAALARVRGATG